MNDANASRPTFVPGPDHPITVRADGKRVRVQVGGRVVADSTNTLALKEASYPEVRYVPRSDVDMTLLERTAHTSYCPYKGTASYFSIPAGGTRATNAIWSYEAPYPAVSEIRDYLAFYPDRVDAIEVEP